MEPPFVPGRRVGPRIVAEDEPCSGGGVPRYRALEISTSPDGTLIGAQPVVLVQPYDDHHGDDPAVFRTNFAQFAAQATELCTPPAPSLLHILGTSPRHSAEGAFRPAPSSMATPRAVVLEHVEGVSLARVVHALREEGRTLPPEVALAVITALLPLWKRGDGTNLFMSSRRVLLTSTGIVKFDLRLALEYGPSGRSSPGTFGPHPDGRYLSAQTLRGEPEDPAGRMYALGMLLMHMLFGEFPLPCASDMDVLRLAFQKKPPVGSLVVGLPTELETLVDRSVAADAQGRFEGWPAFDAALERARGQLPPAGPAELLEAIPAAIRPSPAPPVDPALLAGWRELPMEALEPWTVL